MSARKTIVLAFSGGLDTSYCAVHLSKDLQADVVTVTVDTGGFSADDLKRIAERAKTCGAREHITVDARDKIYNEYIAYLIQGNVLRGGVYPLSVAAERIAQAAVAVDAARRVHAAAIAHGSTGAGNDQIRFDVTLRVLGPEFEILTPIRDRRLSRQESTAYLQKHGIPVAASTTAYSINAGLWGTTIGGKETHDSWTYPPDAAFTMTAPIDKTPDTAEELALGFERGLPVSLNGKPLAGPALIEELNRIGAKHGVGRGIHVGDTILGIKGRIAFEAPGALIVIQAHKELEKLTLTKQQAFWKNQLAEVYGGMLHEGDYFDPVMRDIEAYFASSQQTVSGETRVRLHKGNMAVTGARSPYSLFDTGVAKYGEDNAFWTADDARGFGKIKGIQAILARQARSRKP